MVSSSSDYIRTTGVLLHPTALPESPVCGTFGLGARKWLQSLARNQIGVWQLLPLSPTDSSGSPYSSPSSFALNPWFLDAEDLFKEDFLSESSFLELPCETHKEFGSTSTLNFSLAELRSNFLGKALIENWDRQDSVRHFAFNAWCNKQAWLEDHSLFMEIRRQHDGLPWWKWPKEFSLHNESELDIWKIKNEFKLLEHKLLQWHLHRQWQSIRSLARDLGVLIFGDIPFYVARDSSDVWSHRSLFSIGSGGDLEIQSGVPPDYFSEHGQLWGTPVYDWPVHLLSEFNWWRSRFARQWEQFDLLRLDHFRALVSYWAVPGTSTTAIEGFWKPSPGKDLLSLIKSDRGGKLPLIAEDLGVITPEVEALRDSFYLPGMKILQFAFDGNSSNPYLPENIKGNSWVVYTGTHDNSTTLGWWNSLDKVVKGRVAKLISQVEEDPVGQLLELGLSTDACLVIVPLQDLIRLDDSARFNTPGTTDGNWSWRFDSFDFSLESNLSNYGERGISWGRSKEDASRLV